MDRPPIWRAVAIGLLAGALGAAFVLVTFTRKGYGLGYHVPLAVVFAAALADEVKTRLAARKLGLFYACALAAAIIAGRLAAKWPVSGHGICGALLAVTPLRPAFRICGVLIAIQAIVTKGVIDVPGDQWPTVVWGAAVGSVLGLLGRFLDRRAAVPTSAAAAGTSGSRPRT